MGYFLAFDFGGTKLTAALVEDIVFTTNETEWFGARTRLFTEECKRQNLT